MTSLRFGNFDPPIVRVMTDDRAAISSAAYVEFEAVTSVGKSEIKRRNGIFRDRLGRPGAAMAKKQRGRHHRLILAEAVNSMLCSQPDRQERPTMHRPQVEHRSAPNLIHET